MKSDWLIFQIGTNKHILTESNEATIKALLLDLYEPYMIVKCFDYVSGQLLDEMPLNALYSC